MEAAPGLRAGFASRDITPRVGHPNSLGGREHPVTEIWAPLRVGVFVLDDGQARAVWAGLDLCGLLEEPHRRVREAMAATTGVDPELIVANSSHTHSAPYLTSAVDRLLRPHGLENSDPAYVEAVVTAAGEAAREAVERLEPVGAVRVGHGSVVRVAANRRPKLDGVTVHRHGRPAEAELRDLPEGLIDPDVHVVALERPGGGVIGTIASYGCHTTAAGGDYHGWLTPDFAGPARARVERATGAPMVFLQGCGGNVGTGKWIVGTPAEDVEAMGERLATGIAEGLARAVAVELGPLRVVARRVELPYEGVWDIADLEREFAAVAGSGDISRAHAVGDRLVFAQLLAGGWRPRIVAMRLGDLALASLPGEVFVDHGLRIRADSPIAETIVAAYDDNSLQYVPTEADFPEGAYEVNGGWRYVAPGGGERLADEAQDLLRELAATG
jgi:hypothetical protein